MALLRQITFFIILSILLIGGSWLLNQRLMLLEQQSTSLMAQFQAVNMLNHSLTEKMNQLIPTGTVVGYTGTLNVALRQQLQQQGWLVCDGNEYPITDYPLLYQAIQTSYGVAAEKMFKVPDFRGVFLRGLDLDKGYDPLRTLGSYQSDANKVHTHTGETEYSGIHQHHATSQPAGQHQHLLEARGYWYTSKQKNERPAITQEVDDNQKYRTTPAGEHYHDIVIEPSGEHRHSLLVVPQGEIEARPKNYPVIYLIKY